MRRIMTLGAVIGLAAALLVPLRPAVAVHGVQPKVPPATLADARPGTENVWQVHVGGGDLKEDYDIQRQFSFMSFYPETLQVRQGDLVEWRFGGGLGKWHGLSFEPVDMDATLPAHRDHQMMRYDEIPGVIALDEGFTLGNEVADEPCGPRRANGAMARPARPPCVIDSTTERTAYGISDMFWDSAQPYGSPFWAYIDLEPGLYRYHCKFHFDMQGYIEVVPAGQELPSPQQVEMTARAELEADIATGEGLYAEASQRAGSTADPLTGKRTWDVFAGVTSTDRRVAINDFIPSNLSLAPGDEVRFVTEGTEPQTVTFPSTVVGSFAPDCDMNRCEYKFHEQQPDATARDVFWGLAPLAFPWACEYDEPASGRPALNTWGPRLGCAGGGVEEWQLGPNVAAAQPAPGDMILTDTTFHNSGMLYATDLPASYNTWPDGSPVPHEFRAVFETPGTFTFGCLIHPGGMEGAISVRRTS